jgi:hypothetical protein
LQILRLIVGAAAGALQGANVLSKMPSGYEVGFGGTRDIGSILEPVPEGQTLQGFEVSDRIRVMDDELYQGLRLADGHSDT